MKINEVEKILMDGGIEPNESKVEAKMIVKHFLGLDAAGLLLNDEFEENADLIEAAKLRAKTRKPIQHILGYAHFMGEDFIVNEHVLIPRDETEILVRKAVELLNEKWKMENGKLSILDIGTGSGCIACMLAKLTNAQVLGVDISADALQIALDNSSKMGLFNKAIFRKSDIFSNIHNNEKFDIIVSNPPYIPPSERGKLQKEVEFDPELALFTKDDDGIEFYDKIIKEAPDYLNENGYLLFELGIGQAEKVKSLMKQRDFTDIGVEKDLAGIERIIWGRK